jgi:uncharacterized protein
MVISRYVTRQLDEDLNKTRKIAIIYGPRQVGKTTISKVFASRPGSQYYNCDLEEVRVQLAQASLPQLSALVAGYDCIVFDEAQRVTDIGLKLKILHDHHPDKLLIATGSSSFELANRIAEPLTGRSRAYQVYPLSESELRANANVTEVTAGLEHRLIYGGYPEVVVTADLAEKRRLISDIAETYALMDVLGFAGLKGADYLRNLLKLLAFQVGSEVSINELAQKLNSDGKTVQTYIDLLVKTFIIHPLPPFAGAGRYAMRRSISRYKKYYFYDLGLRNAFINNFNPLALRDDVGALWENYLLNERIKAHHALRRPTQQYFWRSTGGPEVDLVEDRDGQLELFEFKWSAARQNARTMQAIQMQFARTPSQVTRENYERFVL